MPGGYQSGHDKNAYWNGVAVNATSHNTTESGDLHDVSNAGTNGRQALIAGLSRDEGNISLVFDVANTLDALGIVFGAYGTIVVQTGGTPISKTVRVAKRNFVSAVNAAVTVNFDWKSSVT